MLTIGEFSKITRVSAKTLRYYDQIGLLKPGYVSGETGYRYYEVRQLRDMLLISRLKLYQFSLPEIAAVLAKNDAVYLASLILQKKELLTETLAQQQTLLLQMERDLEKIERCESIMQSNYLIKTMDFSAKTIYSLRKKMSMNDFGEVFGTLYAGLGKSRLSPAGPCLSVYHDEDFNKDCTEVEVGVIVPDGATAPGTRVLDPGLCCCTVLVGSYDDFTAAYTAMMEWLDQEGYTMSGPPFEIYIKGRDSGAPPSEYVTEIYFPIKK